MGDDGDAVADDGDRDDSTSMNDTIARRCAGCPTTEGHGSIYTPNEG